MRRLVLLLAATALPLAFPIGPTLTAQAQEAATAPTPEARVEASRKALEAAQAALALAEDTGGDIRGARKSVANALKSLRAAELAAGVTPSEDVGTAAAAPKTAPTQPPETTAPKAQAPAETAETPAAKPTTPAQPRIVSPAPVVIAPAPPATSAAVDGPKPYAPPVVAKPEAPAEMAAIPAPDAPIPPRKPPVPPAVANAPTAPPVRKAEPRQAKAPTVVRRGGYVEATYPHPNGAKTIDVSTLDGRLVRRIEVDPFGNEVVVIDQERVGNWQEAPAWRAQPRWAPPYGPREVPPPGYYDDDGY